MKNFLSASKKPQSYLEKIAETFSISKISEWSEYGAMQNVILEKFIEKSSSASGKMI